MSGDSEGTAVALDQESAVTAAIRHEHAATSVSDVSARLGQSFDPACVGSRYSDKGAALTAGIDSASAALRSWGAASAAVADAVRTGVLATSDLDRSSAAVFGQVGT